MNALDYFLTATPDRLCDACRHARASALDGLYCHRSGGSPFPCQVGRASSTLEAWLYGACGREGRFFEARAAQSSGTTRSELRTLGTEKPA